MWSSRHRTGTRKVVFGESAMKIRIAQFGLGPIGLAAVKLAAAKPWAEIVGGIDIDPGKCGQDLGRLTGIKNLRGRRVCASLDDLLRRGKPDVIFHTTVSRFKDAFVQIEPMVDRGISVISTCEELLFPQLREPKLTRKLALLCKQRNARVIGAGVNPGFIMDLLPLCLTGIGCAVRSIHVRRVVNASTRRRPLQKKIGSSLPPAEFGRRLREGKAGHAGLQESLALIAYALGWKIDKVVTAAEPVIADRPIQTEHFEVRKGETCGIHQSAQGSVKGKVRLTLDIQMYLDAPEPYDAIQIEGNPPLNLMIKGGVDGDLATVGALVNTAPRLLRAQAGLLLVTDLPVPRFA
jgi:2,4-diaminopentanoate dehydrogenase